MQILAEPLYFDVDTRWLAAAGAAAQTIAAARFRVDFPCSIGWADHESETGHELLYTYPEAWGRAFDPPIPHQIALAAVAAYPILDDGQRLPEIAWDSEVMFIGEMVGLKHLDECTKEACAPGCELGAALEEVYELLIRDKTVFMALRAEVYRRAFVFTKTVKELFDEHSDLPLEEFAQRVSPRPIC